jgi:hypothetical protein
VVGDAVGPHVLKLFSEVTTLDIERTPPPVGNHLLQQCKDTTKGHHLLPVGYQKPAMRLLEALYI